MKRARHDAPTPAPPSRDVLLNDDASAAATRATRAEFKAARRARAAATALLPGGLAAVVTPAAPPEYAFAVDDARDHAETPFEAYRDLEPLLFRVATALGKTKATLRIYDPFFCAGSVVAHLGRLGFACVRNANADFYAEAAAGSIPEFDFLLTNPPFSGDHIERTLSFAARCGKPWAVLIPDFCSRKPYWARALGLPAGVAAAEGAVGAVGAVGAARAIETKAAADTKAPAADAAAVVSPLCGPLHYLGPTKLAYMFAAPGRGPSGAPLAGGAPGAPPSSAPRVGHVFAATFQCCWHLALGAGGGPAGADAARALAKWHAKRIEPAGAAAMRPDVRALPQLALDATRKRREGDAARKPWRKKLMRQRKAAARAAGGGGGGGGLGE